MNQATAQCMWLEPLALCSCLMHVENECTTEANYSLSNGLCHVKCLVLLSRNSVPNLIEIQKLRNENKRRKDLIIYTIFDLASAYKLIKLIKL